MPFLLIFTLKTFAFSSPFQKMPTTTIIQKIDQKKYPWIASDQWSRAQNYSKDYARFFEFQDNRI